VAKPPGGAPVCLLQPAVPTIARIESAANSWRGLYVMGWCAWFARMGVFIFDLFGHRDVARCENGTAPDASGDLAVPVLDKA
jgi:hypothetical protein